MPGWPARGKTWKEEAASIGTPPPSFSGSSSHPMTACCARFCRAPPLRPSCCAGQGSSPTTYARSVDGCLTPHAISGLNASSLTTSAAKTPSSPTPSLSPGFPLAYVTSVSPHSVTSTLILTSGATPRTASPRRSARSACRAVVPQGKTAPSGECLCGLPLPFRLCMSQGRSRAATSFPPSLFQTQSLTRPPCRQRLLRRLGLHADPSWPGGGLRWCVVAWARAPRGAPLCGGGRR